MREEESFFVKVRLLGQLLNENLALVGASRSQDHILLHHLSVIETTQHRRPLRRVVVRELIFNALSICESLLVQIVKRKVLHLSGDKRVVDELANVDPVFFHGLQALEKEEAGFDLDVLTLYSHLVAAVVDLPDQLAHLEAVEGGHTHK